MNERRLVAGSRSSSGPCRGWSVLFGAILALAAFLLPTQAFGQLTITGQVVDQDDEPLVATDVLFEALQIGTVTDENGRYRIVVPESRLTGGTAVLSARRLGYTTNSSQVSLVSGETTENFALRVDPLELERLVAIGQGLEQRRETLSATINTVEGDELRETVQPNVVAALAGKAPNVEVTSSAGDAGAGAYIRIRGANSLVGGTQPLFVVDGQPIDNSSVSLEANIWGVSEPNRASDLNPEDIESIEILKGPAAAVYGSRAKNGVILITTKQGRRGTSQVMYKVSGTWDEVNENVPLQRSFGRGLVSLTDPTVNASPGAVQSWGPALAPGTPTFDHAGEMFKTGNTYDQTLQLSGGTDRTTYFMSLGRLDQEGTIVGNSEFTKTTVRLKGSHGFTDNLVLGGNFAYAQSEGDFIQKGSALSGLLLPAFRTPPEFNNLPYKTEGGLQRSYRCNEVSCPTGDFNNLTTSRGFDNPFWASHEVPNTSEVGRVFGNVELNYEPLPWLNVDYLLGTDYWADERLTLWPKGSSENPVGQMIRADYFSLTVDSSIIATASRDVTENVAASLSVGHNFNHDEFRQIEVAGFNQILGTDQLDFSIDREPNEFRSEVRTDGIFANANVELADQLFLNGGVRGDKASTFGEETRFWYPNGGVAWEFTASPMLGGGEEGMGGVLDFGKLRYAYGEAGSHPPVFSNISAFNTTFFDDGWLAQGLNSIYQGFDGVVTQGLLGNPGIEPERSKEHELGVELAFLDNRVALDVVRYWKFTEDAILTLPIPPSSGFTSKWENGAEWENEGWEVQLDVRPVQTANFAWEVGAQWARNESCVTELLGSEQEFIDGFSSGAIYVIQPDDINGDGVPDEEGCHPFGVIYSGDWIRFGRGSTVGGVNIDEAFPNAPAGAIYVQENGLPTNDPQRRVIGDPNPDWTGSVRNTVTLFNRFRVSALIDVKHGGDMWNGTKGALFTYGTHKDTEQCHGAGCSWSDISEYLRSVLAQDEQVAGPGAGTPVTLNRTWFTSIGGGFGPVTRQFIEDAGFVKLRDISVAFTIAQDWAPWIDRMGMSSIDVRLSGRNLKTWTDYTGIDPETNLVDQSTARGLDYFNHPQTRSWAVTLQFNR